MICDICEKKIENEDERHDYHEDGCGYEENGICYCTGVAHPECCPECNGEEK